MRDPQRIDRIANELGILWKEKVPDWRFGQLLVNWLSWLGEDPFYMGDREVLKSIQTYLDTLGK